VTNFRIGRLPIKEHRLLFSMDYQALDYEKIQWLLTI